MRQRKQRIEEATDKAVVEYAKKVLDDVVDDLINDKYKVWDDVTDKGVSLAIKAIRDAQKKLR
jgi:hypothetical protein